MSDIISSVKEIKEIQTELKRKRDEIKFLNDRKQVLEDQVLQFLDSKDQMGVKYKDIALVVSTKKKREYKKKADRLSAGKSILESRGVSNSADVLKDIMHAMKGDETDTKTLKITSQNKK